MASPPPLKMRKWLFAQKSLQRNLQRFSCGYYHYRSGDGFQEVLKDVKFKKLGL